MFNKIFSLFRLIPSLLTGGKALLIGGIAVVAMLGAQELRVQYWKAGAYKAQQATLEMQLSNQLLSQSIEKQNEKIIQIENAAQVYADQASLAALRAKNKGYVELAKIKTAPAGHKEMNRWLTSDFLP